MAPPRRSSLKRRRGTIEPLLSLEIFTEGEVTEPRYLHDLARIIRNSLVRVNVVGTGNDPRVLVKKAVEKKKELDRLSRRTGDSFDRRFEVWAMFDVDEHKWFSEAKQEALQNGISVAISNPCFEIWGIYHFVDHHAPITAAGCVEKLRGFVPNYGNRGKVFVLSDAASTRELQLRMLQDAVVRGRVGIERRSEEGEPHGCPSSNCYELVARMQSNAGGAVSRGARARREGAR